jgi:hypothetical protein
MAYDEHPLDERDEWGDLASFGKLQRPRDCAARDSLIALGRLADSRMREILRRWQ